ncbi:hypothetical protein ISR94_00635 [Candidatus Microgenomates bacterium]|nr:hypothetical protein [Candidatus Microgenomates bacterium]
MIDIRQSQNYAKYLKTQGWIVERIDNTNYFVKKMPLLGSVLKIQRPKNINWKTIKKLQKKYRVFQTIIEPCLSFGVSTVSYHNLFISDGYKLSKSSYLPSKTSHINLDQSLGKITAGFKKDTRRAIRVGEKTIIKDSSSPEKIKLFRAAWKKSVRFTRFIPSTTSLINLRKSFPNTHSLFLTSHNDFGEIIGGSVFTRSSHGTAYYWYGFTNKEGRASLSQYSLLYQGILWAKKQKCRVFDFEGIYDERFPNKSWLGFTRFKKSFGGRDVLYPGAYYKNRFSLL